MARYRFAAGCFLAVAGVVIVYAETKEPANGPELAKALHNKYGVVCDVDRDGKIFEAIVDGNDVKDARAAIARLSSIKSLRRIVVTIARLDGKMIRQLSNLPSLEYLSLVCDFDSNDLEPVQNLTLLKELTLDGAQINDTALIYLKPLKHLERLSLYHTKVTGTGFSNLESLPLRSLNLSSTPITDSALSVIGKLKTLQELDLSYTRISDQGITHLSGLYQLISLAIVKTKVTPLGKQAFIDAYTLSRKEADSKGLLPKKHPQLEVIAH